MLGANAGPGTMKRRQGFTLVELLVSMALIIFIMAILSQAFVSATNTFRNLKAAGDMAEKLRATTQLLQHDLAADHFEGKKRLSNPNFWNNGPPLQGFFQVYHRGFVGAGIPEGQDLNQVESYRSVNHSLAFTIKLRGNQMGDFLSANSPMVNNPWGVPSPVSLAALIPYYPQANAPSFQDITNAGESRYQVNAATNPTYSYQWAEVAWFMEPSINPATLQQDMTVPDPNSGAQPLPLYTLYRRQRLAVPDNSLVPPQTPLTVQANLLLDWSCWLNPQTNTWYFNSPTDLTVPGRRFNATAYTGPPTLVGPPTFTPIPQGLSGFSGSDIQLTDVVSFDVRLLVQNVASPTLDPFVTLQTVNAANMNVFLPYHNNNPSYDPGLGIPFDTWSSVNDGLNGANFSQWNAAGQTGSIPLWNANTQSGPIIQAIQISIRVWDSKTNQTRQVTMVQAM